MNELQVNGATIKTVQSRALHSSLAWFGWFCCVLGLTGLFGAWIYLQGITPSIIAFLVYFIGAGAIIYRPRYGLYLIMFLGLVGDNVLSPWFPFTKNFSSYESLLFVHDSIIISPLESYIALTFLSWLIRAFIQRKPFFFKGMLFWPSLIFLVFVIFGMVYGVSTGGNFTIALWEARPIFYLFAMIVLTSNLLDDREHVTTLIVAAMLALFVKAVFGNYYYFIQLKGSLSGIDAITEHAAAIQMNTVFVLALAAWLYKSSWSLRLLTTFMIPFLAITYIATQRRAAFLSLAVAFLLMIIILFKENRKLFYIIVPPLIVVSVFYLGIFWNRDGALAMPARALKSVVAEDQASYRDQSSNAYRVIENINTSFTVHQKPLTGVGFGQKFFILVPLPDISFFEWWEYFPHNSIIWIWLKAGVGGFFAMLYLVGSAIMLGASVSQRMPPNNLRAIALTMTLYLVMHFLYAYVDISWDTQSMLYIGTAMGILSCLERIVAKPMPPLVKRWPWQPDPLPLPGLVSLTHQEHI